MTVARKGSAKVRIRDRHLSQEAAVLAEFSPTNGWPFAGLPQHPPPNHILRLPPGHSCLLLTPSTCRLSSGPSDNFSSPPGPPHPGRVPFKAFPPAWHQPLPLGASVVRGSREAEDVGSSPGSATDLWAQLPSDWEGVTPQNSQRPSSLKP